VPSRPPRESPVARLRPPASDRAASRSHGLPEGGHYNAPAPSRQPSATVCDIDRLAINV